MASSKKISQKLSFYLILAFLLLFPFGQLASMSVALLGSIFEVKAVDLIAFAAVPLYFFRIDKKSSEERHIVNFLLLAAFSQIISIFVLGFNQTILGSFYFIRLLVYFTFFCVTYDLFKQNFKLRDLVSKYLLVSILFGAILGWLQYFFFPDLTSLKFAGWDDHLYRLAGTFLDPGFAGIIFAMGAILSLESHWKSKNLSYLAIFLMLAISVVFTFSSLASML